MVNDPNSSEPQRIIDEYYAQHYQKVHSDGCLGDAAAIMHKKLENGRSNNYFPVTLELGSGAFQHYKHVRHRHDLYIASDLRVPSECNLNAFLKSARPKTSALFLQADALHIPHREHSIDRIVATCLILHLPDPYSAIREWQRVCRPNGVIDFLVPCDPGIGVRMFRRLISERTAMRYGVSRNQYRLVNALEHVNGLPRVRALALAALEEGRELKINFFPWRWTPSWNLNAFAIFSIVPKK